MRRFANVVFVLLAVVIFPVVAQSDCPTLVQTALTAASQVCQNTGRNQACYGNVTLEAENQNSEPVLAFDSPGDLADIANIRTLSLSSMNTTTNEWGVALLKVQANLPDTIPGQSVTMLLFGDVEITNPVNSQVQPPTVDLSLKTNLAVRSSPSMDAPVVQFLETNTIIKADGRLNDALWLRVLVPNYSNEAWLFLLSENEANTLTTVNGDLNTLSVVTPGDPLYLKRPMQAFYFRTGINDAGCVEAPDSGILIQTPSGAGEVNLVVNDVRLSIGSTAYLQAQPNSEMVISTIEGNVHVEVAGVTRNVIAGTRIRLPINSDSKVSGQPSQIEPYADSAMQTLPIQNLERQITVSPALTDAQIAGLVGQTTIDGVWHFIADISEQTCVPTDTNQASTIKTYSPISSVRIRVEGNGASLTITVGGANGELADRKYIYIGEGKYQLQDVPVQSIIGSNLIQSQILQVVSSNLILGEQSDFFPDDNCYVDSLTFRFER